MFIQVLLNTNKPSYNLATDGVIGSATDAAIRDFQRVHGMTQDGVVGSAEVVKSNETSQAF